MFKKLQWFILCLAFSFDSLATEGLVSVASKYSFENTADNLEKVLLSNGMTIFARVPHSSDALKVDIELKPTELIIFGNPQVGGKLMQCAQTVAIDLPLKALVWQDRDDNVWISYNDPEYLKKRHDMVSCDTQLRNVAGALTTLVKAAVK